MHRDVKPQNLIVNEFSGQIKLVDFGTTQQLDPLRHKISGRVGTPAYIDPTVLRGDDYGLEVDIYSLGLTVWQLVSGSGCFGEETIAIGKERKQKEEEEEEEEDEEE